jgi:N-acetylneuraminic acid mutarotase
MPLPRSGASGAFVGNKFYIVGGYTSFGDITGTTQVHRYNATQNAWVERSPAPRPRIDARAAVVDDKIYIFSGVSNGVIVDAVDVYDPQTDTWSTLDDPMPSPPLGGVAIAVTPDGKIMLIGGSDANGVAQSRVDVYDPATDTWAPFTPLQTPRSGAAAAVLGTTVYVFAGSKAGYLSSVEASPTP